MAIKPFNIRWCLICLTNLQDDIIYYNDDIELAIKDIYNGDLLIEIETNNNITTIKELKEIIESLEIPFEKDNYFVKKAEERLGKVLDER